MDQHPVEENIPENKNDSSSSSETEIVAPVEEFGRAKQFRVFKVIHSHYPRHWRGAITDARGICYSIKITHKHVKFSSKVMCMDSLFACAMKLAIC
jgi:hypothetical protein